MAHTFTRSSSNKVLGGVLAGLAGYMNWDVALTRVIFVVLLIITGFLPFGLAYLIAWMIVPKS